MPDYLYDFPKYYELAFSYRNIKKEVDVIEECIKRFSGIRVKSMLELACGNCPFAEELVKRGYSYTGFDINPNMIRYSREKLKKYKDKVSIQKKNMVRFSLDRKTDFIFILLDSIYIKNKKEMISLFNAVANSLKKGGLFFMDWCIHFIGGEGSEPDIWEIEKKGIKVKCTVFGRIINPVTQLYQEDIILEINDKGRRFSTKETSITKSIYPQEFLFFLESSKKLEFIGWWNNWDLSKSLDNHKGRINRPIILVRKK